ncbi:STAS domain-containing protein [Streptomyces sp. ASQP_92]|uniref:STAS domain-containing protein n=1 Tax=Streptomyces sp. ASQP_92 TaxID=2979116 RepID=UPI0021C218C9|nr:STAS domain-containing protein [Streptomyces sp. ASQP_92]MCT9092368.1 STAS domain-containing protein [Streptomyces sp. ASQP_92]
MGIRDANAASGQRHSMALPEITPDSYQHARTYRLHGVTVVELRGTIDLSTVPKVQVHTDAATTPPRAQVIVDLRPVQFLDCSALGLLCRARRRAVERDGRLALVCVRPWHLRILEATGLRELFRPHATVEEALLRKH